MKLTKLIIQNFKSFGANKNELEFDTEKGNLCLIVGKNGNGKSTLGEAIDFAIQFIVKG